MCWCLILKLKNSLYHILLHCKSARAPDPVLFDCITDRVQRLAYNRYFKLEIEKKIFPIIMNNYTNRAHVGRTGK